MYNERYAKVIDYRTNDAGQYDRINVQVHGEDKSMISVKPENLVSTKEAYKNMKEKCVHDIAKVFRPDDSLDTFVPTNPHAYEELKDKFPPGSLNKIVELPNSTDNGSFGVVIDYKKEHGKNFICIELNRDSETTLWVEPNNLQNIPDAFISDVISPVLRQIKLQNSPSSSHIR